MKTPVLAAILLAISAGHAAAVTLTTSTTTYSQDFDSLAASGAGHAFALDGWSLYQTNAGVLVNTYGTANGSNGTAAGFFSFGNTGESERALGSVVTNGFAGPSGSGSVAIVLALTNGTTQSLDSLTVSFDGEQWRRQNTVAHTLTLQVGVGTSYSTTSFVDTGYAFTAPQTGSTSATLDGNLAVNRMADIGGAITLAGNWAPDATLWLRWYDHNDVGNDQLLAIDNVRVSISPVPEPATYALMLGGLAAVGLLARRRRA